jgi:tetratricopeptide (TPR) repeat protein
MRHSFPSTFRAPTPHKGLALFLVFAMHLIGSSCTPMAQGSIQAQLAAVAVAEGDHDAAQKHAERSQFWRKTFSAPQSKAVLQGHLLLAYVALARADLEECSAQTDVALSGFGQARTDNPILNGRAHCRAALLASLDADWPRFGAHIAAANQGCTNAEATKRRKTCLGNIRSCRFEALCRTGNVPRATPATEAQFLNMADHPSEPHFWFIAQFHYRFGDYSEALRWIERGRAYWEEHQPSADNLGLETIQVSDDISVSLLEKAGHFFAKAPPALDAKADSLRRLGRFEEGHRTQKLADQLWATADDGERGLTAGIALHESLGGPWLCRRYAARAYYRVHKLRGVDATADYEFIMPSCRRAWAIENAHMISFESSLDEFSMLATAGSVERRLGNVAKARSYFETMRDEAKRLLPRNRREVLDAEAGLAALLEDEGKLEEAESAWLSVLRQTEAVRPPNHPDTAWTLWQIARVREALGQAGPAEALRGLARQMWTTPHVRRVRN